MEKVSEEQILEAVEQDDNIGFCISCGMEHYSVEPDARGYECENCGKNKVFGAEELLLQIV
jgi:predicted RNA-binding Zn-ribbon protein involved in translation (DUF1610 family)